ncbi:Protein vav [Caenorhabditis elegans]|uniref:Protein vav n=1 Tax=Caenorhabditis elegans TaxID=6239 RepID=A0A4V0ILE7_CAEEL|nr:Protein vav [Caenorhabditis elegans]VTW47504.1 Protein vav [Caenorhabditis elegans]
MLDCLETFQRKLKIRDSSYSPLLIEKVPMNGGCDLWIGCARWLRDMKVLTTDKNGTMLEFASVLRDGILLCRLANTLVPNGIDQKKIMRTNQPSPFLCCNNINYFAMFCKTYFNLEDADLFTAEDLYYMNGFQKVLKTLSFLSHTKESLSRGVDPFPDTDNNQEGTSNGSEFEDDVEIYQSLHDNIENVDPNRTIYGPITSADPEEQQSEQLYDRIVTNRKPSMNENDLQNTPTLKRNRCIRELYDTEKNYVAQALVTIIKTFYEPLKGIIPTSDYNIIFGNIEEINVLHTALLADLEYPVKVALGLSDATPPRPISLNECVPQTIGEVFIKYRDQFLAYGKYCSNLPDSRKLSNELLKTNEFISRNINELTAQGNCKFGMNDLLCVPFQRLTKYPLLLKELQKKTDLASPDRKSLEEAVEVMEDVCNYINEESRDTNAIKVIDEIEQSITDLSMPLNVKLHDYGRVNLDGEVKMAESTLTQAGKPKQRYIFLFDKVIVVCKAANKVMAAKTTGASARTNTFTYKNAYVMSELTIDKNASLDVKSGGTITRRTQYVIIMTRDRNENNEITQLTFYFKNEATRNNWMTALLLSKSNVSPTDYLRDTNHKVAFHSFRVDVKNPATCDVCDKLMKGLQYQGYKCESCNMSMHKECLGLKKCEAVRKSTHETRSSQSFNCNRPRFHIHEGDIVVANSNSTPSDLSYLQFAKGDRIEVIKMQGHNRFTGCLINNRNRTGLVHLDHVSQSRTTSMIGLSPIDSPAGSIAPRVVRNESTVLPNKLLSDGSSRSLSGPHGSRSSRNSSSSTINGSMDSVPRQQDYVNTEISEFLWYMGEMERAKAESTLKGTPNGTFLVRYSKNRKQTAISLSYKNDVKHMIIEQNSDGKVYLDEDYIFNSTVELVQYYRSNNLIEIFAALDTCLKNPYSQCKVFKAVHDYDAPSPNNEGKFLSFKTGDIVVLLDTVGEDRGWWKGQVNNKSGFFPLSYVKPYDPATEGSSSPVTPTSSSS